MKISVHNAYVLYKAQSSTKKYKTMFKFVKYKTMFDEEVQNHEKHEEKASSYKKHEVRNHVKKNMFKFVLQLARQLLQQQDVEAYAPEADDEDAYDVSMLQCVHVANP